MTDTGHSGGSQALEDRLRRAENAKEGSYHKRTGHLDQDGRAIFINRLILEDSPYLLQHAHNPVNWFPWGAEAFEVASREDKPIFLSIGYSTCHWCHVMEIESFDNVEVARALNRDFISIKMDREQYPDIDEIYMTGVQLMSGQGGWPMSNFLLPDGKPFFGATYFPAANFLRLLQQITEAWRQKRDELENSAGSIGADVDRILGERRKAESLDRELGDKVARALSQREDRDRGGLAGAPKFPQEPLLLFMLDRAARKGDGAAYGFAERALDGMARGGIHDQVAGGFHRYSVDKDWLVPHFEKMLYNQSQLGLAYLRAVQLTGNPFFERVCELTLRYVLRDMQLAEGGFYSATDADSEGSEGTFFLWTIEQLEEVLNEEEAELAVSLFNLSRQGNFEAANILHLTESLAAQERRRGADFVPALDRILEKLYHARETRPHPLRDDKLIVAWTGAMITTLARAGFHFDNPEWLAAAEKAAAFVFRQNVDSDGKLLRIYLNETSSIDGQLEDYANLSEALITLFDITATGEYLRQARRLTDRMLEEFRDEESGGFFLSPGNQVGPQITRSLNAGDGATLSPVATALRCLVLLNKRSALAGGDTAELHYRKEIDRCIAYLAAHVNEHPLNHTSLLRVINEYNDGAVEPIQYAGNGLARVRLTRLRADTAESLQFELALSLVEGWQVTAPSSAAGELVPVTLGLAGENGDWRLQSVDYPAGSLETKSPATGETAVLSGEFRIRGCCRRIAPTDAELSRSVALELRLQLCNEQYCRSAESLYFRI